MSWESAITNLRSCLPIGSARTASHPWSTMHLLSTRSHAVETCSPKTTCRGQQMPPRYSTTVLHFIHQICRTFGGSLGSHCQLPTNVSYLRNVTRPGRTTRQGYAHTIKYQSCMRFVDTRVAPKLRCHCDFQSEVRTSLTSGAYHVPSPTSRRTDREVKLQEPKELVATPNIRSYTHTVSSQQIRQHSKNNLDTTASTRA